MANKSQTGVSLLDVSATMITNTPVLVAAEDNSRGALLMMNCAANDILIFFAPAGSTSVPTIAAGAKGVYCLKAAVAAGSQGGSYEPDGGFIPPNAVWAQGTTGDVLVAHVSKPVPTP